ncbi:MAG: methylenetetrahydrofolate reductase [NAD(P)H] [Magnetococcales bacterium]|nr:methylenetetrahydrofolate reductase [NAD(P)H] [Magnetococcales bacterium]MBF0156228.1 methylenetetrahydrofolate reductase [NAD(P)H] [Magnetococcales bacterium]
MTTRSPLPGTPGGPLLSFEFFPPKGEEGEAAFWKTLPRLARFEPDFISITYGAGGSDRERTKELVCRVRQETGLEVVAHLTCIGDSREALVKILDRYRQCGLRHLLALRGDRPRNAPEDLAARSDFPYADSFVAFVKANYPEFAIGVAAYPEVHPEAASAEADLAHFQRKIQAGAEFAATQFFFENAAYFRFVSRCREAGLTIPIYPGIMPVVNYSQIRRLAELCGSALPEWLTSQYEGIRDDPEKMRETGIRIAVAQCRELLAGGAPGLHFFTLNQAETVSRIVTALRSPE